MDGLMQRPKTYAGATGRDLHIDAALTNLTIGYRPQNLIAQYEKDSKKITLREAMVKVFEKDPELLSKWNRYNSANAQ